MEIVPPALKDTHDDRSFEQDVYDVVRAIPEGRVTSYGAIARCWVPPREPSGGVLNKVLGHSRRCLRIAWCRGMLTAPSLSI